MARLSFGRKLALIAAGGAVLGSLAWAGAAVTPADGPGLETAADRPAQPVRVSRITFQPSEEVKTYTGLIRPHEEVALGFRTPGKIVRRSVDVGDRVVKGQVVALLDDVDARLQVELALAERDAARTDRTRAEADLERGRTLFAQGHIAQAVLDRLASGAAEAASRAERATRSLDLARNQLAYTELVADADGVVTATLAEVGQVVAAGQAVVSVAGGGGADVVFALPEQDRASVETAVARAEVWGGQGKTHDLTLRDVSPDVDPAGRTYRVRLSLLAPDAATAFGRTVTVTLAERSQTPAAPVPLAAILNDGRGSTVWKVDPSGTRVVPVAVRMVAIDGTVALIQGDLAEGDMVVSLGAHKIDPDRPVRLVETFVAPES